MIKVSLSLLLVLSVTIVLCNSYQSQCYSNSNNRINKYSGLTRNVKSINDETKDNLKLSITKPLVLGLGSLSTSFKVNANDKNDNVYNDALPANAYTKLGNMKMCRILNGMWQVSGY